jgi:excisionase family DNA binding protein
LSIEKNGGKKMQNQAMKKNVPAPVAMAAFQLLGAYTTAQSPAELLARIKNADGRPDTEIRLLTLNEAAKRLRVTRQSLYNWRAENKISFVKIGQRRQMVPVAEIERIEGGESDG